MDVAREINARFFPSPFLFLFSPFFPRSVSVAGIYDTEVSRHPTAIVPEPVSRGENTYKRAGILHGRFSFDLSGAIFDNRRCTPRTWTLLSWNVIRVLIAIREYEYGWLVENSRKGIVVLLEVRALVDQIRRSPGEIS